MSDATPEDTETSAMAAWLRSLEGQQPEIYEADGVPVLDQSSQSDAPTCSYDALKRT